MRVLGHNENFLILSLFTFCVQFKLKSAPKGAEPAVSLPPSPFATAPSLDTTSAGSTHLEDGTVSAAPERFHSFTMETRPSPPSAPREEGRLLRTLTSDVERAARHEGMAPPGRAPSQMPLAAESPPSSIIERFYRQFW